MRSIVCGAIISFCFSVSSPAWSDCPDPTLTGQTITLGGELATFSATTFACNLSGGSFGPIHMAETGQNTLIVSRFGTNTVVIDLTQEKPYQYFGNNDDVFTNVDSRNLHALAWTFNAGLYATVFPDIFSGGSDKTPKLVRLNNLGRIQSTVTLTESITGFLDGLSWNPRADDFDRDRNTLVLGDQNTLTVVERSFSNTGSRIWNVKGLLGGPIVWKIIVDADELPVVVDHIAWRWDGAFLAISGHSDGGCLAFTPDYSVPTFGPGICILGTVAGGPDGASFGFVPNDFSNPKNNVVFFNTNGGQVAAWETTFGFGFENSVCLLPLDPNEEPVGEPPKFALVGGKRGDGVSVLARNRSLLVTQFDNIVEVIDPPSEGQSPDEPLGGFLMPGASPQLNAVCTLATLQSSDLIRPQGLFHSILVRFDNVIRKMSEGRFNEARHMLRASLTRSIEPGISRNHFTTPEAGQKLKDQVNFLLELIPTVELKTVPAGNVRVFLPSIGGSFNPLSGDEVAIRIGVPEDGNLTVSVLDLQRNLVKVLFNGVVSVGEESVKWDGTNSSGVPVASGVYVILIEAENFTKTKRVLVRK